MIDSFSIETTEYGRHFSIEKIQHDKQFFNRNERVLWALLRLKRQSNMDTRLTEMREYGRHTY